MLLDEILSVYDFTEVHSISVKASPEVAYRAVMETTLNEISGIVRWLFILRSLPEKTVGRQGKTMQTREPLLSQMNNNGFVTLAEQAPHELVFGLIVPGKIGRVWQKASGNKVLPADATDFLSFSHPGFLRVVGNFRVEDSTIPGMVTVRTESRTRALSYRARTDFIPYWRIIRPFSGLIRRLWLRGIKRRAEGQQAKNNLDRLRKME
jgi:hypothetical protein